jgi:hypothetical protein
LILQNFLSPGDLVMLTAAVRDLHRCYPRQFITDVRTACPDLWLHNPHLTPLWETAPDVEVINCSYPLIHCSNETPFHALHGFIWFLNKKLGLRIAPTEFRGEVLLSPEEKLALSQVAQLAGCEIPFWLIVSGGKFDYTAKWWDPARFQKVVDHFRGRIQFVQAGEIGHHHPKLHGAIDLRGRTTLRELIRLVYHAQGVVCGVTALMHLAAAVELPPGSASRPAVIIAGGREPTHWEAYPHHQFIHTIGALPCCADGGCWRSRVRPLGDGEEQDESLCADVVGALPRCMDMISAVEVIHRIERYFIGGTARFVTKAQAAAGRRAARASDAAPNFDSTLNLLSAFAALRAQAKQNGLPPSMSGRGVLLLTNDPGDALKLASLARRRWPELPIELRSSASFREEEVRKFERLRVNVTQPLTICPLIDALVNAPWREVLVLSRLNDLKLATGFRGTTFLRDSRRRVHGALWRLCGMQPPRAAARRSIVFIDRKESWRALKLTAWMATHHYLFLRELGSEAAMIEFADQFLASARVSARNSSERDVKKTSRILAPSAR